MGMGICEVCGNHYSKLLHIEVGGHTHLFDCFECAIHALAPACTHCHIKVIGHGVDKHGHTFCSDHCARQVDEGEGLMTGT